MKHLSVLATLGLLAGGCGSSTTPSTVNPTFTTTLLPANEVPSVVGAETSGSGTVTITFNTTKDASGNISSATADFVVNLSGYPANTPVIAAHIHSAAAGTIGGVVISTGLVPGDVVLSNGSGSFTKATVSVTNPSLVQAIMNNPASYYFNVHSRENPGGFSRGQLNRIQ
jgi:hypothetical protein